MSNNETDDTALDKSNDYGPSNEELEAALLAEVPDFGQQARAPET